MTQINFYQIQYHLYPIYSFFYGVYFIFKEFKSSIQNFNRNFLFNFIVNIFFLTMYQNCLKLNIYHVPIKKINRFLLNIPQIIEFLSLNFQFFASFFQNFLYKYQINFKTNHFCYNFRMYIFSKFVDIPGFFLH